MRGKKYFSLFRLYKNCVSVLLVPVVSPQDTFQGLAMEGAINSQNVHVNLYPIEII